MGVPRWPAPADRPGGHAAADQRDGSGADRAGQALSRAKPSTADTSVVVAALSTWHEHHTAAVATVDTVDGLPAHVLLESASVLTRLPGGLARPLPEVLAALQASFGGPVLTLPGPEHRAMLDALAQVGLAGGAVYDGLIAATARHHGAQLLTMDQRAMPVYRALGTDLLRVAA